MRLLLSLSRSFSRAFSISFSSSLRGNSAFSLSFACILPELMRAFVLRETPCRVPLTFALALALPLTLRLLRRWLALRRRSRVRPVALVTRCFTLLRALDNRELRLREVFVDALLKRPLPVEF